MRYIVTKQTVVEFSSDLLANIAADLEWEASEALENGDLELYESYCGDIHIINLELRRRHGPKTIIRA